jgi:hypothetical protein
LITFQNNFDTIEKCENPKHSYMIALPQPGSPYLFVFLLKFLKGLRACQGLKILRSFAL